MVLPVRVFTKICIFGGVAVFRDLSIEVEGGSGRRIPHCVRAQTPMLGRQALARVKRPSRVTPSITPNRRVKRALISKKTAV